LRSKRKTKNEKPITKTGGNMNIEEIRSLYNQHIRQAPSDVFATLEIVDSLYRYRMDAEKFGMVLYSDLKEENADTAIAETLAYFRGLGYGLEWKHLSYDEPYDLKQRLTAAGLTEEEEEAVMVLAIEDAPEKLLAPIQHDIRRITTAEALKDADAVNKAIWDDAEDAVSQRILPAWERDPESVSVYVAYVDGKPVSYARNEFMGAKGNPFVGLYGGQTLPEYRNRGIYSALIAARLREAEARGSKFLFVDARQMTSMPILQKLGFVCIGYATAFTMEGESE
jgi:GNAT superfamily N-acetyltransferase